MKAAFISVNSAVTLSFPLVADNPSLIPFVWRKHGITAGGLQSRLEWRHHAALGFDFTSGDGCGENR